MFSRSKRTSARSEVDQLGRTLLKQKKYGEAETVLRQAVHESENKLGKDHDDTLDNKFWLECTLYAQKKYGEARELFQRTKAATFPDIFLQKRADYWTWKEDVWDLIDKAGILPLLTGSWPEDKNERRKAEKEDEALRLWILRQLPEYLSDLLEDCESSHDLWLYLEDRMRCCPFCKGSSTLHQIERAADHGCDGCQLVLQIIQTFRSEHLRPRQNSASRDINVEQSDGNFVGGNLSIVLSQRSLIEKYCVSDVSVPSGIGASPYLRTPFAKALCLAFQWLNDCISQHPHCAIPDPTFMPRRVISVGGHHSPPFLVEHKPEKSPYAALSYCWGLSKNTLVTKRDNLHRHFTSIDFQMLPKSVKDAIVVCRGLDIPYLWVDAICIVQDDINEGDWYEQSKQMGAIYSNAHLVISVDVASHCTDGFLLEEQRDVIWTPISHRTAKGGLVVRLASGGDRVDHTRRTAGSLGASALSQRGWSMQECILPHRILHFAKNEIIWECSTSWQCECGNPSVHGLWKMLTFVTNVYMDSDEDFNHHITDFVRGRTPESVCWIWERLVERYSQRVLTVSGDKLSAISGLAMLFQKTLDASPSEYVAGLWKTDLPQCLLWHVTGSPMPSRPAYWRAPSWSWASIDGGIGFFNERYQFTFESHVEILECFCAPSSVDLFGRVRDGRIRLLGNLAPVVLDAKPFKSGILYEGQYVGSCGKRPRAHTDLIFKVRGHGRSYEVLLDMRIEAGTYPEGYYCLDIGRTYNPLRSGTRRSWLVLQRSTNAPGQASTFERIGIGTFDSSTRSVDLFSSNKTELILL